MFDALPNVHPFLVHFPVALFLTALACDIALVLRYREAWLDRAVTLLYGTGALLSGVAAFSGKLAEGGIETALTPEAQQQLGLHSDWAFFTVVLAFVAFGLRFDALWRDRNETAPRLQRGRIVALLAGLLAGAALLTAAAHGGALVYRHGIGIQKVRP